ncbi:MAG: LysM peptidoglycan-binding domain-containing protein [Thermoclostridium sp.]|nr:LysM peptidoglycan-binding domain-containing protein [Thermoclostridium sp.]
MKRKLRLNNKKRFFSFIFLLVVTIMLAGSIVAAAGEEKSECRSVTVMPGDTLWDIAQENAVNKDIRKYIFELKKINQLDDATIYAGQNLFLP